MVKESIERYFYRKNGGRIRVLSVIDQVARRVMVRLEMRTPSGLLISPPNSSIPETETDSIAGVFVLLLFGMLLSILIAVIERFTRSCRKKDQNEQVGQRLNEGGKN